MAPTTWHWPLRRFIVTDRSMEPALCSGDGLLGSPYLPARVGQLRCLPDPRVADRWLVKRVAAVADGRMEVASDNWAVPTSDSRVFGPVPVAGSYAVVLRVPARWL